MLSQRRLIASIAFSMLIATSATVPGSASVIYGPVINPANHHSYYLLSQSDWSTAETEADTLGGHLVTINDAAENQWVYSTFANFGGVNRYIWLGLTDAATEGLFVWISGEPVTYTHWHSGEPNNNGNEDCVLMDSPYFPADATTWNDLNCSATIAVDNVGIYGVVEIPYDVTPVKPASWGRLKILYR